MRRPTSLTTRRSSVLILCGLLVLCGTVAAASKSRAITKPKYDPDASRVEFFEGVEQGAISYQVIAKDALGGQVLIENKTDQPLTVELPEAVVGVQVLPQGMAGGGFGFTDPSSTSGSGNGGGQNQAFGGGGFGGGGLGGGGYGGGGFGGGGFGGGGFFSIPPESKIRLPYKSVCLEHGKKDPHPRVQYKLVRVEEYTDKPELQELIKLVGTGKLDAQSAQAAAWHLANDMSWQALSAKLYDRAGAPDTPFFSRQQLAAAQSLVAAARSKAEEAAAGATKADDQPVARVQTRQPTR